MGEDAGPTPEPDAGAEPEEERHAPTAPWYGAVVTVSLFLSAAWLLSYTLLDWDWQQELGAWNYAAVGVLIVVTSALMKNWRADLARNDAEPEAGTP